MKNEYYDIACTDLKYVQFRLDSEFYNQISVDAQQVAEKMLKSVLELVTPLDDSVDKLMRSHNIRAIYDKIAEFQPDFTLDRHALSTLMDYYFDAKYLGDNFVLVDKGACSENLEIMYDVIEEVNHFRSENGLEVSSFERLRLEDDPETQNI